MKRGIRGQALRIPLFHMICNFQLYEQSTIRTGSSEIIPVLDNFP